jgi:thiamine pyrophosphate-dependent acetolactate synthase large subunit-like protein
MTMLISRLDATRRLLSLITDEPVIASLGHPAYDLFTAGDRPANFYTWGSMGLASSIGLGLAMAKPERRVIVLDGDGSLLMNLGSLATIADVAPSNLVVIVWDNELYGTTGGQPTATAQGSDLEGTAKALGIPNAVTVRDAEAFDAAVVRTASEAGPWIIIAKVSESGTATKPPLDSPMIKRRFMAAMGNPE